jgi:hypothetical protein
MNGRPWSSRVRQAVQSLGGESRSFTADVVADELKIKTYDEYQKIKNALYGMAMRGELKMDDSGGERTFTRTTVEPGPRERAWKVLRAKGTVTASDLAELAGVSRGFATTCLTRLLKAGFVSKVSTGKYRLIKDQVEPPGRDDPCTQSGAALRKKDALRAIDNAVSACAEARMKVAEMGTTDEHR